jgi:AAA domain
MQASFWNRISLDASSICIGLWASLLLGVQGAERDVIFFCTTVTRPAAFPFDAHRLNVALTRARNHLIVVGCASALQASSPVLKQVLVKCCALPIAYRPNGSLPLSEADDPDREGRN